MLLKPQQADEAFQTLAKYKQSITDGNNKQQHSSIALAHKDDQPSQHVHHQNQTSCCASAKPSAANLHQHQHKEHAKCECDEHEHEHDRDHYDDDSELDLQTDAHNYNCHACGKQNSFATITGNRVNTKKTCSTFIFLTFRVLLSS